MKAYIFISYSRNDQKYITPIVDLIRASLHGFSNPTEYVFLDIDSIQFGDKWQSAIDDAISRAEKVFVFWCVHSADSEEVQREYMLALGLEKIVIPVLIDDCPLSSELAPFQGVDLRKIEIHEPSRDREIRTPTEKLQPDKIIGEGFSFALQIDSQVITMAIDRYKRFLPNAAGRSEQEQLLTSSIVRAFQESQPSPTIFLAMGQSDERPCEFVDYFLELKLPGLLTQNVKRLDLVVNEKEGTQFYINQPQLSSVKYRRIGDFAEELSEDSPSPGLTFKSITEIAEELSEENQAIAIHLGLDTGDPDKFHISDLRFALNFLNQISTLSRNKSLYMFLGVPFSRSENRRGFLFRGAPAGSINRQFARYLQHGIGWARNLSFFINRSNRRLKQEISNISPDSYYKGCRVVSLPELMPVGLNDARKWIDQYGMFWSEKKRLLSGVEELYLSSTHVSSSAFVATIENTEISTTSTSKSAPISIN